MLNRNSTVKRLEEDVASKRLHGLGKLLKTSRSVRRLTLRQVSIRLAEQGEELPPCTLSRIEHGKLDPSVRRLFLLLDLYHVPASLIGHLVRRACNAERPIGPDTVLHTLTPEVAQRHGTDRD